MVPRLAGNAARSDGRGKSFRDLSAYLFEGELDQSNPERVAWAGTLNSRIDDPSQVWREMAWTAEHADELKEAAGVRRSGRKNEAPVWHVSLNWHDSENPTRAEMEDAAKSLLERFGLEKHQALMVAHDDTDHAHLHLMVNLVSPEDGRTVDVSRNGKRRLSKWALDYENERGEILCPKREENHQKRRDNSAAYDAARSFSEATGQDMEPLHVTRDDSPHRELWNTLKQAREMGASDDGIAKIREMHRDMWRKHYEQSRTRDMEQQRNPAASILQRLTKQEVSFSRQQLATMAANATGDAMAFRDLLAKIEGSGEIVALPGEDNRYTTQTILRTEQEMGNAADLMAAGYGHEISKRGERIKDRAKYLSDDQRAALSHITNGQDLACVVGYAGTGKSTMLGEARKVWEASGYRVTGAALSGIAAEGLQDGSGIESRTIASLQWALSHGKETLTAKDVLVLDEAGMVGSRQMHTLLTQAQQAGAKVVLVGDPAQLQAIDAGGAFRAIVDRVGAAGIHSIRRQHQDWQKEATVQFAHGNVQDALAAYDQRGMVTAHRTKDAATAGMVAAWEEGRHKNPNDSQIMLAPTRKAVAALNVEARARLQAQGKLGADVQIDAVEERMDKPTRAFKLQLAKGDRILFTKNDKKLNVKNGTLGTVEKINKGRVTVAIDGDRSRRIDVDLKTYRNLAHGYALTIHKAQGVTVDRTHVLASRTMDRHASYVAMTRHKEDVQLHYAETEFRSRASLDTTLSRDRSKTSTLDYFSTRRRALDLAEERAQVSLNFQRVFAAARDRAVSKGQQNTWMRDDLVQQQDLGRTMRPN